MGFYADLILEGDNCQYCSCEMDGKGYPQTCEECLEEDE